jgi:hypothetical protein
MFGSMSGGHGKHAMFVLDESGLMAQDWAGVEVAYRQYKKYCLQNQRDSDLVSVVQFDGIARIAVQQQSISAAPNDLSCSGGYTCFNPAAWMASQLAHGTPPLHVPAVVFMSDGGANDAHEAVNTFSTLNQETRNQKSLWRRTRAIMVL